MYASSQPTPPHRLLRTYLLRGLDRKLYRTPPVWPEGTFIQDDEETGQLILYVDGIASSETLTSAIAATDQMAVRFRLAVARRTGCPLLLRLVKSQEPNFDPPGHASGHDSVKLSDRVTCDVIPRDPPTAIEQPSRSFLRVRRQRCRNFKLDITSATQKFKHSHATCRK